MTITVDAIYEQGVLRPVQPLALAERERVRVTVESEPQHAPVTDDTKRAGGAGAPVAVGTDCGAVP
jgi:predicted DNA-binding antitoxin AbrB/MazE fold protein